MNKTTALIIIAALFLILLTMEINLNGSGFTEKDAANGIKEVSKRYGQKMAKIVEQVLRLETANFQSAQFKHTGSAGMEAGSWGKYIPKSATDGIYKAKDNSTGVIKNFIVWRSCTDFCIFLAEYINRHNGNYANWNSTEPAKQQAYRTAVEKINTKYA